MKTMMKRTGMAMALAAVAFAGAAAAQDTEDAGEEDLASAYIFSPVEELAVNYDVNLGGLTLGSGRLRVDLSETDYDARISIRTAGLADWLFNSTYENTSRGAREGTDIFPREYNSDFRGRRDDDYQLVEIGYDGTTPHLVSSDPSYGPRLERFPVTEEQRTHSYDPLNAAMHLISGMPFSEDAPCGERIRVFDGRRRYDLVMEYVGHEDIRVRRGEVWDGEALVCHLNYEEVAGFKPQPEDDELPRPPMTLYIAELEEGYFVPVRVRAPTPLGSMVMVATFMRVREVVPDHAGGDDSSDTALAAPAN
jgi:hypothetical protein